MLYCAVEFDLHEAGDEIVLAGVNATGIDVKDGGMESCVSGMTGNVLDGVMTDCD